MSNNTPVISCQNVWKIFGQKPDAVWELVEKGATRAEVLEQTKQVVAVRNASFEAKENEIFVIMGLSGSGKSTLVRCLNRLLDPTRGKILIDGEDITKMKRKALQDLRRHKLSMVFQNFGLLPHRSVLDNVAFGLEIRGEHKNERQHKALAILDQVGLKGWENSRVNELSGGMQQRVGLARALVVEPEIILMDEPFSALDPLIRRQMQDEFIKLRNTMKKTVVFITHDLLEALRLGDRIAIMKDGEIVQLGTPQEIIAKPADNYVSEFIKDVPRWKIIPVESVMEAAKIMVWNGFDVEVAIREMMDANTNVAFIINSHAVVQGILTLEAAIQASRRGLVKIAEITQDNYTQTTPLTPVEEIIHVVVDSDIPVAVLDENKRLLGVVSRYSLNKAMETFQQTVITNNDSQTNNDKQPVNNQSSNDNNQISDTLSP